MARTKTKLSELVAPAAAPPAVPRRIMRYRKIGRRGPAPATIGEGVRRARQAAGLGQIEAATIAAMAQPHLCALERDLLDPKWSTLVKLAEALKCSVRDFAPGEAPAHWRASGSIDHGH